MLSFVFSLTFSSIYTAYKQNHVGNLKKQTKLKKKICSCVTLYSLASPSNCWRTTSYSRINGDNALQTQNTKVEKNK